jgi:transcriptional regulator with XRE-family HTH domain
MNDFANKLKKLRKDAKISQEELANVLGMGKSTISLYESGKRMPDYSVLMKISDYFNCSTDYLLGREDQYQDQDKLLEQKVANAVSDDLELLQFWLELSRREDLQLLFKQVRPLSPASIKKIIGVIKAIYEETEDN